ncbi:MAG: hypothetical protein JSU70_19070 [Phycisphaerales bacterium]|nr:MAG: hypothetical protein JSU70_19070 [Phycisphaerales bacterium]
MKSNEFSSQGSDECASMRQYSHAEELINNLPYVLMAALGAAIFLVVLDGSAWAWIMGATYLAYGIAGAFWIMVFVCPFCRYWDTSSCPCGYGLIAARLRKKADTECFNEKFKRHIPVIVPLWIIPALAGIPALISSFSWLLLALLVVFALDAYLILPLVATQHGCKDCPQKDTCPWMSRKGRPVVATSTPLAKTSSS